MAALVERSLRLLEIMAEPLQAGPPGSPLGPPLHE